MFYSIFIVFTAMGSKTYSFAMFCWFVGTPSAFESVYERSLIFHGCRKVSPLLINHSYNPRERGSLCFYGYRKASQTSIRKTILAARTHGL